MAGEPLDRSLLESLRFFRSQEDAVRLSGKFRDLPEGVDPYSLARTGWGILISPEEKKRGVLTRLGPLLSLRRSQAGELYHEETFEDLSAREYLWVKHGDSPGTILPGKGRLPYYLLIIGSPAEIPYEFQFDLAVNRAVGRVYFEDLAHYTNYAEAVCAATGETKQRANEVGLFSVTAADENGAIRQIEDHFIHPLRRELEAKAPQWSIRSGKNFETDFFELLQGGDGTPGLLLTACHGLDRKFGRPDQKERQGALSILAVDSRGKISKRPFAASELHNLTDRAAQPRPLQGMIAALFACYSAGTPQVDSFRDIFATEPALADVLAESPFLASLPTAMLSSGALAVLGHVDRGQTASFVWKYGLTCTSGARSLIDSILQLFDGHRLGHALRPLFRRYSYLAAHMLSIEEAKSTGFAIPEIERETYITALRDSRYFLLLGDPAVTLKGTPRPGLASRGDQGNQEKAEALFLNPGLAARARAEAAIRGLNLTAWVQEVLESELGPGGRRAAADLERLQMPVPIGLLSRSGHSFQPASGSLISLANPNQPPRLWIEERKHGKWCVAAQDQEALDGLLPSFDLALEALLKWARVTKLKELAATKPMPSIELTLYRREHDHPKWIPCAEDGLTIENGTELRIDVQNLSNEPMWLYLLDIGPDGALGFIQAAISQSAALAPGERRVGPSMCLQLPETLPSASYHLGAHETLIAFGSTDPVDIRALFCPPGLAEPTDSGPLSRILADVSRGRWRTTIADADLKSPGWGTLSRTFRILKAQQA